MNFILAQTEAGNTGSSYFTYTLIALAVIIFLFIVIQVADNLISIEARQLGVAGGNSFSLFPKWSEIFSSRKPAYLNGEKVTVLKQGHDILLEGGAEKHIKGIAQVATFAIQPANFIGVSPIPKLEVEVGQEVKAGDILYADKKRPYLKWAAPVSGEIVAINRGEKRAIAEIVIMADKTIQYRQFPRFALETADRAELVAYLMDAGIWPLIRQRPFHLIPDEDTIPRDIFISTFDTAPLAPDLNLVVDGQEVAFQKGLDVLAKLTSGQVHLGLDASSENAPHAAFTQARGVAKHWFSGKHPAGNVGIQIHHIRPIGGADDVVWTVGVQEVITIGKLFTEQKYDASRVVVLSGAELEQPQYVQTWQGANLGDLVKGNLKTEKVRIISGDVLSGVKKDTSSFLNFFDDQVSVILEGDYFALFGWLLPTLNVPSVSPTFPSALLKDTTFRADTNTHGEKRAFVVTGNYEEVLPMDIYPQMLFKSILTGDFERMEGLGIYELAEEDVALCEFVCVSKQPIQEILRKGLETMRAQA
ncbi:MAG TPA: Na(+)-translocating NADH-quinone reductase subunit A [Saprospiraceae bacterium]|nr:Na(+)-translocating NADH-quinone reductase subunit A [Saprospiraceae bacterium]HMQ82775.1 Na(+)-translocating NADH-quinone reductase subunit A [Saprospiraceae bacterium]